MRKPALGGSGVWMDDWIEGKARRVLVAPQPPPKLNLLERAIHSEWRIRIVWGLRAVALGLFAYWQPVMAACLFLGAVAGYNFGFKDARKGWLRDDGTPIT